MSTFFQFDRKVTIFFRDMQIISVIFTFFMLFYLKSKPQDALHVLHSSCTALKHMFPHTKHIRILFI